ncbi:MAG: alpha/beta hydrolase-fold protein [Bacteroidota bacterium]
MYLKSLLLFLWLVGLGEWGFAQAGSFITHRMYSPFQADSTNIRVLLPDSLMEGREYQVLYVLPVKERNHRKFGDGLEEVRKTNVHNTHHLICVAPEFTRLPWYCNHATDSTKQDESHLLKTVLPFVDAHYPTLKGQQGRLLVGFSKSGWGSMSLLLRHPNLFWKAAVWDSGVRIDTGPMREATREEKIGQIFGSMETFRSYRLSWLIREKGKALGKEERLLYYNTEGNRAVGGAKIHMLLVQQGIPHRYLFESKRRHRWDSGWIPEAVRFLVDP